MSWLASLFISGLLMSNFGDSAPAVGNARATGTATVQTQQTAQAAQTEQTVGEEIERFDQTYPFNANGSVALSNVNGSVTIETWDRNEVKIEYTKTGSDKEILSWVDVRIDATKERIEVEANYDNWKNRSNANWESWKGRKLSITFKLTVPRTAILNEIETVNGSITLSNLTNNCKVSTVNGQVSARNLRGNANLSTVNGIVEADFDKLDPSARISLSTVNGKALLTIPSDSDATVKADTVNGTITNDFGLPVRKGQYVGRDLHGKVGNGATRINLSSVNGGLAVSRKQDGRSLSPATNLLTMKKSDEDDDHDEDMDNDKDDEDDEDNVSRARMDRDVERAIRDAVRVAPVVSVDGTAINAEVLKEMAKAQKEIVKAQKETTLSTAAVNRAINGQVRAALRDQERQLQTLGTVLAIPASGIMPSMEKQGETFTVKGTPKVVVEARNCAVTVRGWDRSEVQYSLTKFSRSIGPNAGITVEKGESKVQIRVTNNTPANHYRLEVFVPRKSNLKISTDREIRLDGVSGEIDLTAANEEINVRDSDGKLSVVSEGGNVRVVGFQGEFSSTTSVGTVSLEGEFTKLNADAGDGTVVLTLPENTGAYLSTETDNIFAEGLSLTREDEKWKVGKGGDTYRILTSPEGKVVVRNSNRLKASY